MFPKAALSNSRHLGHALAEVAVVGNLDHPSIVAMHSTLNGANHLMILMEYVGDRNLHQACGGPAT